LALSITIIRNFAQKDQIKDHEPAVDAGKRRDCIDQRACQIELQLSQLEGEPIAKPLDSDTDRAPEAAPFI